MTSKPLVVYIDVDDTLVRSFGAKRVPMTPVIAHVSELYRQGVTLYCWSTAGPEYAQRSARELGIESCFVGFLPKPNVLIDDQPPRDWRTLIVVHPNEATSRSVEQYEEELSRQGSR